MRTIAEITKDDVLSHFHARAQKYDASSRWCTDPALGARILAATAPAAEDEVLDVACGTGLVSRLFKGRVKRVVGSDITRAMFQQAAPNVDEFVEAAGESLPFEDGEFDLVVCRQGIQFMDARAAVAEMVRVTRPGGRVCLIDLVAYGEEDRDEYFEVLRLRNPARKNFFMREDPGRLLEAAGCTVERHEHVSRENVEVWSDNGAISADRCEAIRRIYRHASEPYRRLHRLSGSEREGFLDDMLFMLTVGKV